MSETKERRPLSGSVLSADQRCTTQPKALKAPSRFRSARSQTRSFRVPRSRSTRNECTAGYPCLRTSSTWPRCDASSRSACRPQTNGKAERVIQSASARKKPPLDASQLAACLRPPSPAIDLLARAAGHFAERVDRRPGDRRGIRRSAARGFVITRATRPLPFRSRPARRHRPGRTISSHETNGRRSRASASSSCSSAARRRRPSARARIADRAFR